MEAAARRPFGITEFEVSGPSGKRFEPTTERQLDADLRSLAERLPGAEKGVVAVVEFPGPRGVPDLLAVTRSFEALDCRLASGPPFIQSAADCAVVTSLDVGRTRSAMNVATTIGMSLPQATRRLRALEVAGAVISHGKGYRRSPAISPIGRMYAFEAKVSDWRRGLDQALRYSTWADASSLVLLRPPGDIADLIEKCTTLDIGLAIRDEWIRRPKLGRPYPPLRLEASERLALELSALRSKPFASSIGNENR